jgi:hypothetical protein
MKLPILLTALLLSASPVVADDYLYLEYVKKSVTTTKDLKSNQITNRVEDSEISYVKVDLANSRTATAKTPEWEENKIVNDAFVIDEEWTANGFTTTMKASMQVVPPYRIVADALSRNDAISQTLKGVGICKAIDASVFEKALNQPN